MVPRNQTNSVVSFQVILATAVVCITVNETFEITACSDPNRVEVILDNIKEVVWNHKGRSEICECGSDELAHSIQGINAGELTVTQIDIESFPIANSAETTPVLAITLTWNLTSVGQASGAEMNFTLSFFTEHQDILFDGQIAEVFNGTIKTTYEVYNLFVKM